MRSRWPAVVLLACAPLRVLADGPADGAAPGPAPPGVAPPAVAQPGGSQPGDAALEVVRRDAGIRLVRPDAAWEVRDLAPPGGTHHALRLERAPAPGEISFSVYLGDATPGMTADLLCAANEARWRTRAAGPVAHATVRAAGGDAPALTCEVDAPGGRVRLRQVYVVREGDVALLQCQAPAAQFDAQEAAFAAMLASFEFLGADASRDDARRIRMLAARCGNEVPRARTWAEAASRAGRDHRLVLVVFELYRGLPVAPYSDTTAFMDEDVVALCDKRLVVLPWNDQMTAPFTAASAYGLGPHTFGTGALVATPEGEVVGSIGVLEPVLLDAMLRSVLAAHPEATGPFVPDPKDALAAFRRGELDRAETLLAKPATADEWLLRAALMRRLRRADDALAALDAALAAGADAARVAADRGLVLLRAARIPEAVESLRKAGDLPAAKYWLAIARALREGVEPVRADLVALTAADPPDRWSLRAAAVLAGRGVLTGAESVAWPDTYVLDAAAPQAAEPLGPDDVVRARTDAVTYLLATQRPDGTWPSPLAFTPDPTAQTTVAVTAIAGAALLPFRGRRDVDGAVARAVEAVLRACPRMAAARPGLFDYTVWAQIFSLRFLLAVETDAPVREAARLRVAAGGLANALSGMRQPSGGWSYIRLEGTGAPADNSISFLTAVAWLALREAKDHGLVVPDEVLDGGAALLASLRRPDGTWAYQTASPGITDPAEAALRGPLCALALRRAGRSEGLGDLEASLAAVAARFDASLLESGKSLCHTAPEGTAAYYLLYGYRFAAEALRELPAGAAAPARRALLAQVLRFRRADGSFADFPPIGPAYGTAMALEALRFLQ